MLTTQAASQITGLSKRSLQYYDDLQLIQVPRDSNNHRMFDEKTMERIWKILWYKELGFTLKEIKELLDFDDQKQKEEFHKKLFVLEENIQQQKSNQKMLVFVLYNNLPSMPNDSSTTFSQEIIQIKKEINKVNSLTNSTI